MKKMRTPALISGLLLVTAIVVQGQVQPQTAQTKQSAPKEAAPSGNASEKPPVQSVATINDAFAKAGLRALSAILGDATLPVVTEGGDILLSKQVVDAISAADSEARTDEELRMSTVLSALHISHSLNNQNMELQELRAKLGHNYQYSSDAAREMETREVLAKDPGVAALKDSLAFRNVAACGAGLESLFRARKSGPIPPECTAKDEDSTDNPSKPLR